MICFPLGVGEGGWWLGLLSLLPDEKTGGSQMDYAHPRPEVYTVRKTVIFLGDVQREYTGMAMTSPPHQQVRPSR